MSRKSGTRKSSIQEERDNQISPEIREAFLEVAAQQKNEQGINGER